MIVIISEFKYLLKECLFNIYYLIKNSNFIKGLTNYKFFFSAQQIIDRECIIIKTPFTSI